MAAKHHRHVALTEPLARFLERQVAEGRYAGGIACDKPFNARRVARAMWG